MIMIEDKGDGYDITTDMDDNATIQALAYAVAGVHVDMLPSLETKLDMHNPDDRARAAHGSAVMFGLYVETVMEKMLERQAGLQ